MIVRQPFGRRGVAGLLSIAVCTICVLTDHAATAQEPEPLAVREERALRQAVLQVAPSVVQIRTIGGLDVVEGQLVNDGPTSGIVISEDGYIVSSAFNFAQKPSSILVTFESGKQAPAELVATDHSRMVVLLKASGVAELPVPQWAPTDQARPGQWAVAVGRTFRADRTNVTVGIVSAVGRMYGKAVQTDADVSTANYGGPLVDIRGRVLGIIVPMAPRATSELAGAEWYDSGIGFAVPIDPTSKPIERMKNGEDLHSGLMGVGMKPSNPHSSPAEIAVVRTESPGDQAGLKKGDRLIEINGTPIRNQTDMRFALGTAYDGDIVRIIAKRGEEQLERSVTLVGELPPHRHAFLGILPMRPAAEQAEDREPGVVVRMVYPGSPAAGAGIEAGDRIVKINDTEIDAVDDAVEALNSVAIGSEFEVTFSRGETTTTSKLRAATLPTSVPSDLPSATLDSDDPEAVVGMGETTELKLPEMPHQCHVYVPGTVAIGQSMGVLLWLADPSAETVEDVVSQWQSNCERDGFILVVPRPHKSNRWERPDVEYLGRVLQRVVRQYKVDPRRVVVGGQGRTGTVAWLLAREGREMVRGVAAVNSPQPRGTRVAENDPTHRLAVFATVPANKESAALLVAGLRKLVEAGFNVTTVTSAGSSGELSDSERNELGRWLDSLDRF